MARDLGEVIEGKGHFMDTFTVLSLCQHVSDLSELHIEVSEHLDGEGYSTGCTRQQCFRFHTVCEPAKKHIISKASCSSYADTGLPGLRHQPLYSQG